LWSRVTGHSDSTSSYAEILREVIAPVAEAGNGSFSLSGIAAPPYLSARQTSNIEVGDPLVHLRRLAVEGLRLDR